MQSEQSPSLAALLGLPIFSVPSCITDTPTSHNLLHLPSHIILQLFNSQISTLFPIQCAILSLLVGSHSFFFNAEHGTAYLTMSDGEISTIEDSTTASSPPTLNRWKITHSLMSQHERTSSHPRDSYEWLNALPLDLIACSPTGSGKTLSYLIPILATLNKSISLKSTSTSKATPQALILVPTRQLALQVAAVLRSLDPQLRVGTLVSSLKKHENHVNSLLGCQVLIATPGRLLMNLMNRGGENQKEGKEFMGEEEGEMEEAEETFRDRDVIEPRIELHECSWLVLDECDRLFVTSHSWIAPLRAALSLHRQPSTPIRRLFLSATVSDIHDRVLEGFHQMGLRRSVFVGAEASLPASLVVADKVVEAEEGKLLWLLEFIRGTTGVDEQGKFHDLNVTGESPPLAPHHRFDAFEAPPLAHATLRPPKKILCFVNSAERCTRLATLVQERMPSICVSQFSSESHVSLLDKFRNKRDTVDLIVSTDVLARGLDVTFDAMEIECLMVVNYDLPTQKVTYLHRAGRTARAGRRGVVINLMRKSQQHWWKTLLRSDNVATASTIS